MMIPRSSLMMIFNIALLLLAVASDSLAQADKLNYSQHIQPIWNQYCRDCHNASTSEGELSLDDYAALHQAQEEKSLWHSGDANKSRLYQLLVGLDEPKMPPEDHPQPTQAEIDRVRLWIDQGAQGPHEREPLAARLKTPNIPSQSQAPLPITSLAIRGDDRLIVGGTQNIAFHPMTSGSVSGIVGKVNRLRYSSDEKYLIAVSGLAGVGGQVTVLDATSMRILRQFEVGNDILYAVDISPDNQYLAVGGYDRRLRLLDFQTGKELHSLDGHHGAIYDIAFHPSGACLATASGDETIKLWRMPDGLRLDTFPQGEGPQYAVRFSGDGSLIIAGGEDRRLRIWKVASTTVPMINPLIQSAYAHEGSILGLAISRRGDWLGTIGEEGKAKAWALPSLRLLTEALSIKAIPSAIAIDKHDRLVIADLKGEVHAGKVSPPQDTPEVSSEQQVALVGIDPRWSIEPSAWEEHEPNDSAKQAAKVHAPANIRGTIEAHVANAEDQDWYALEAKGGEAWILQIHAAQEGSLLDSVIEVCDANGAPILRTRLQAMRESYFTFRGKGSDGVDDFRLHNWQDMELNEWLYAGGEVVKLWLYPRGPDSGFKVYPGYGNRHNYFDTTATAHALGEPAWIVQPLLPNQAPLPNGLPVFPIYYENDDDPLRRQGKDSRLHFTAPRDGTYLVRVRDARGQSSPNHRYRLEIRAPKPDFSISCNVSELNLIPGSGREFELTAVREDGFDGPIEIQLSGLPEGFVTTQPLQIEAHQDKAIGVLFCSPNYEFIQPSFDIQWSAKATLASGVVVERTSTKPLRIVQGKGERVGLKVVTSGAEPNVIEIRPGETVSAQVIADRKAFTGDIGFGNEDCGRNLPHGVIVGNIGLSGLLIPAGQVQQEFFLVASPWLQPQERLFHLRANIEGNPTTLPVRLRVLPRK